MSTEKSESSAWSPLTYPIFRALWIATIASNVGSFMQDVGEAWLMTNLTTSPLLVALVQSAASLPIFLFALPAGAMADIIDRRELLLATQAWMLIVAGLAGALTLLGVMTPLLLLGTAFLMGLGEALNGPAWQAITSELVPGDKLRAAVTLNGAGFNVSRAVGPALAGLVITLSNPGSAFFFNALSFLGVFVVLYKWKRIPEVSVLPPERLSGAMRLGIRYVLHSAELRAVFVRSSVFVLCASAVLALLPVFARNELQLDALGYGILLGFFGAGAIAGAAVLPRIGRLFALNTLTVGATAIFAAVIFGATALPFFVFVCLSLFVAGIVWLALLSSFLTLVQVGSPSWVRGRVLSVFMLAFSGNIVLGGAAWGTVASLWNASTALRVASLGLIVGLVAAVRYRLPTQYAIDFTPSRHWPSVDFSRITESESARPVIVTVEYRIDPSQAEAFLRAMEELREERFRTGSSSWRLFRDIEDEKRYVEIFESPSWVEHQRQHERVTMADRQLEKVAFAFHKEKSPPVGHWISVEPRGTKDPGSLEENPEKNKPTN